MGTKERAVGTIVFLLLSSFFAASLNTASAGEPKIVANGDFHTGDLSGWTLEYASSSGAESLNYIPSVSAGGHNGSNFAHSAYYNYGYCTYRIVQKLPAASSTNKNASCWAGWSFGGYLKVNYTDGSFDTVDIPERLSMSPWTQTVLPLTAGKTLDCIIIHGCGSGGHNGGLTISDIQILQAQPPKTELAQTWLTQRCLLPLAFIGLSGVIARYIFGAINS